MDGLEEKFDREIRRRRLDLDSPEPPGAVDVGMLPMLPAPAGPIQEQARRNPSGPPLELGPGPPRKEVDLSKALGPLEPAASPTPEPSRGRPLNTKEGFRHGSLERGAGDEVRSCTPTPRRSLSEDEPLRGRNFLQFQRQVTELTKDLEMIADLRKEVE